ncbi:MAG: hypothetical protein ACOCYZ_02495 [Halococcoides sp.]
MANGGIVSVTVKSDLDEHNINEVGEGIGRVVFSLPARYVDGGDHPSGYVIKFPKASSHGTANGKEQNRHEIDAWENRLADYQDDLVPITDYHPDYWWVVMPRVSLVDKDSPEGQQRLDELKGVGFEFEDEVELGRYNGEIRLLDYGYEVKVTD